MRWPSSGISSPVGAPWRMASKRARLCAWGELPPELTDSPVRDCGGTSLVVPDTGADCCGWSPEPCSGNSSGEPAAPGTGVGFGVATGEGLCWSVGVTASAGVFCAPAPTPAGTAGGAGVAGVAGGAGAAVLLVVGAAAVIDAPHSSQ